MEDMRRVSVTLTDEMDKALTELKRSVRYARASNAELLRDVLRLGIEAMAGKEDAT